MSGNVLIRVENLQKSFDAKKTLLSRIRKDSMKVYAVDNVSFSLNKGEIIGLIGESGCGKTTTARILLKLVDADGGKVYYEDRDITRIRGKELREFRKKIQIVFQDPFEYLNPRINIMEIVTEPLVINGMARSQEERIKIAVRCLEEVGLFPGESYLYRYSHELSGGQRQRVAIARAIVMKPELVVADEPTSMLDVSIRAGILNLLLKLKKEHGMSMVFITHDIATAGYMCDKIAVMYKGRVVEIGPRDEIIFDPRHPYTKALVSVARDLNSFLKHKAEIIKDGEVDSHVQSGYCSFEKRCVDCCEECRSQRHYEMRKVGNNEHYVSCCMCDCG
jgi:oligopeptide/dipeptide ABC transporter ATP-binding protein